MDQTQTSPDGRHPVPENDNRKRPRLSRPYRSKRHPPCDQCRKRKLRCETDGKSACLRCQAGNPATCSFLGVQRAPQSIVDSESPPVQDIVPLQSVESGNGSMQGPSEPEFPVGAPSGPYSADILGSANTSIPPSEPYQFSERPATQAIQTLDLLEGFSSQLMGASGESDPWLLRHCKFDDHGFLLFHQVHFRNAGGVPLDDKIPVHFSVTADQLYQPVKELTRISPKESGLRERLNSLVPLESGRRLVALYMKFVFPSLPIISRLQFGLTGSRIMPDSQVLQTIPVHVLAAVYASAFGFARFDEHLSVLNAYSEPPTEELWRIVFDLCHEEIHTPHLAVVQAGLLYLHKGKCRAQAAIADSPFMWSFVGSLVGLATSLGLQLECSPMGLPAWERRLRRRLWWAVYTEDKWRSLVHGRPPYIRHDEWDVTGLTDEDFYTEHVQVDSQADAQPFRHLVRLSRIADDVQKRLFSLHACQRLSQRFTDSLEAANPFFHRLREWFAALPPSLKLPPGPSTMVDGSRSQSSCLHFAYILLEVFIFRSLLRPMVRSAAPPPLVEETEDPAIFTDFLNNYIFQSFEATEVGPVPAIDMSDENGAASTVIKAAENCAAMMLRLVTQMTCNDLSGFWYSWTRTGFATVSNFFMLLLVQAPTKDHALRAKQLVDMWRQALRGQRGGCQLTTLALLRLDGFYWAGLERSFTLPRHVKEALHSTA